MAQSIMLRDDLQPLELMQHVAQWFESQNVDYWVVGSLASIAYGEPRFTNNVDMVAELRTEHIEPLLLAFPSSDVYLSEPAVRKAVLKRSQFNIIHPASGLKVDVILSADTAFAKSEASLLDWLFACVHKLCNGVFLGRNDPILRNSATFI